MKIRIAMQVFSISKHSNEASSLKHKAERYECQYQYPHTDGPKTMYIHFNKRYLCPFLKLELIYGGDV